jgi:hypothetical protein
MVLLSRKGKSRLRGCDQQRYSSSTHSEQGEGKDDRCTNHKPSPSSHHACQQSKQLPVNILAFVDFYLKKVSVLQGKS